MDSEKLTKKQRKALAFRQNKGKPKEEKDTEKVKDKKESAVEVEKVENGENSDKAKKAEDTEEKPTQKEDGKKQGKQGGKGKQVTRRTILFVGNLPYNATEDNLRNLFKSSKPDSIRMRKEKGIAFIEFNENKDLKSRVDLALSKHHSLLGTRTINVELTAGGGGNTKNRMNKIKEKNAKLDEERRSKREENVKKMQEKNKRRREAGNDNKNGNKRTKTVQGVHPSRLALMK